MNLRKVYRDVALKEGGKINQSIAQITETGSLVLLEMSNYPMIEVEQAINRLKKNRK